MALAYVSVRPARLSGQCLRERGVTTRRVTRCLRASTAAHAVTLRRVNKQSEINRQATRPTLQLQDGVYRKVLLDAVGGKHLRYNVKNGLTSRILTCTELKGHCFVLISGYVC